MRFIHNAGHHVYDDVSDQWFQFDDAAEGIAFAQEVESRESVVVEAESASRFATTLLNIPQPPIVGQFAQSDPFIIVPEDMSRTQVHLSAYCDPSANPLILYVGSRQDILSAKGYVILVGPYTNSDYKFETTQELWGLVTTSSSSTGWAFCYVSALTEFRG